MSAKLSLHMDSRVEELRRIDAAVEEFARAENWPADVAYQIKLAIEEVTVNVIHHAHDDGAGHRAGIDIVSDADSVTVEIVDDGKPFDPLTEAPVPDITASIEDRPIGGLGVYLVKTMMDETRYRREDGRNRLTLVKRRSG